MPASPMVREVRVPYMRRDQRSRPCSSVPSRKSVSSAWRPPPWPVTYCKSSLYSLRPHCAYLESCLFLPRKTKDLRPASAGVVRHFGSGWSLNADRIPHLAFLGWQSALGGLVEQFSRQASVRKRQREDGIDGCLLLHVSLLMFKSQYFPFDL
jgi:hypothetical protein